MKWKIKIIRYLNTDLLLKLFLKDRLFFEKIAVKIFCEYYGVLDRTIEFDNIFLQFINIFPQIKYLQTGHLIKNHEVIRIPLHDFKFPINRYILSGDPNSKIIYSNYILPHPNNSCIPFSIGISKSNKFKILTSNIFYFEIKLDSFKFRNDDFEESLKIGFTAADEEPYQTNFGSGTCFGINVLESTIEIQNKHYYLNNFIVKGDIIGVGLIYLDIFKYKLFITVNGEIAEPEYSVKSLVINTASLLKVVANISLSTGIEFNFGNRNFSFDIEKINKSNRSIYLTKNNFINRGFNMHRIKSDNYIYSKPISQEYIYNLIPNLQY